MGKGGPQPAHQVRPGDLQLEEAVLDLEDSEIFGHLIVPVGQLMTNYEVSSMEKSIGEVLDDDEDDDYEPKDVDNETIEEHDRVFEGPSSGLMYNLNNNAKKSRKSARKDVTSALHEVDVLLQEIIYRNRESKRQPDEEENERVVNSYESMNKTHNRYLESIKEEETVSKEQTNGNCQQREVGNNTAEPSTPAGESFHGAAPKRRFHGYRRQPYGPWRGQIYERPRQGLLFQQVNMCGDGSCDFGQLRKGMGDVVDETSELNNRAIISGNDKAEINNEDRDNQSPGKLSIGPSAIEEMDHTTAADFSSFLEPGSACLDGENASQTTLIDEATLPSDTSSQKDQEKTAVPEEANIICHKIQDIVSPPGHRGVRFKDHLNTDTSNTQPKDQKQSITSLRKRISDFPCTLEYTSPVQQNRSSDEPSINNLPHCQIKVKSHVSPGPILPLLASSHVSTGTNSTNSTHGCTTQVTSKSQICSLVKDYKCSDCHGSQLLPLSLNNYSSDNVTHNHSSQSLEDSSKTLANQENCGQDKYPKRRSTKRRKLKRILQSSTVEIEKQQATVQCMDARENDVSNQRRQKALGTVPHEMMNDSEIETDKPGEAQSLTAHFRLCQTKSDTFSVHDNAEASTFSVHDNAKTNTYSVHSYSKPDIPSVNVGARPDTMPLCDNATLPTIPVLDTITSSTFYVHDNVKPSDRSVHGKVKANALSVHDNVKPNALSINENPKPNAHTAHDNAKPNALSVHGNFTPNACSVYDNVKHNAHSVHDNPKPNTLSVHDSAKPNVLSVHNSSKPNALSVPDSPKPNALSAHDTTKPTNVSKKCQTSHRNLTTSNAQCQASQSRASVDIRRTTDADASTFTAPDMYTTASNRVLKKLLSSKRSQAERDSTASGFYESNNIQANIAAVHRKKRLSSHHLSPMRVRLPQINKILSACSNPYTDETVGEYDNIQVTQLKMTPGLHDSLHEDVIYHVHKKLPSNMARDASNKLSVSTFVVSKTHISLQKQARSSSLLHSSRLSATQRSVANANLNSTSSYATTKQHDEDDVTVRISSDNTSASSKGTQIPTTSTNSTAKERNRGMFSYFGNRFFKSSVQNRDSSVDGEEYPMKKNKTAASSAREQASQTHGDDTISATPLRKEKGNHVQTIRDPRQGLVEEHGTQTNNTTVMRNMNTISSPNNLSKKYNEEIPAANASLWRKPILPKLQGQRHQEELVHAQENTESVKSPSSKDYRYPQSDSFYAREFVEEGNFNLDAEEKWYTNMPRYQDTKRTHTQCYAVEGWESHDASLHVRRNLENNHHLPPLSPEDFGNNETTYRVSFPDPKTRKPAFNSLYPSPYDEEGAQTRSKISLIESHHESDEAEYFDTQRYQRRSSDDQELYRSVFPSDTFKYALQNRLRDQDSNVIHGLAANKNRKSVSFENIQALPLEMPYSEEPYLSSKFRRSKTLPPSYTYRDDNGVLGGFMRYYQPRQCPDRWRLHYKDSGYPATMIEKRKFSEPQLLPARLLADSYYDPSSNVISVVVKPVNVNINKRLGNIKVKIYRSPPRLPPVFKKGKEKPRKRMCSSAPLTRNILNRRAANPPFNTTTSREANERYHSMFDNWKIL